MTSKGLPGTEAESFAYDENERLKRAGTAEFGYDAADDPTRAPGTTNIFDTAAELELATRATFAHDKEGDRTKRTPSSGQAVTYRYDQAARLTSVERAAGEKAPAIAESFVYDGLGLLDTRTVSGTARHLVWDPTEPPEALLTDGQYSYVYGPGGLPVEQISSGEVPTYLHHDQLGSTRLVTSASGEVPGIFTYEPYGETTGNTGTATTALGYAGQYTLGTSGLQYLRARFYDPTTAQFLTPDPIQFITRSTYGYAKGNPAAKVDPSGLCGADSVGDFLESLNPVSEQNCAYDVADSAATAVSGISPPSRSCRSRGRIIRRRYGWVNEIRAGIADHREMGGFRFAVQFTMIPPLREPLLHLCCWPTFRMPLSRSAPAFLRPRCGSQGTETKFLRSKIVSKKSSDMSWVNRFER